MTAVRRLLAVAFLLALSFPAFPASYVVSTDEELIRQADAAAVVRVLSMKSYRNASGLIVTDYEVEVERALKGLTGRSRLVITQAGGQVGDVMMLTSADPAYFPGERALVLLDAAGEGRFTTSNFELGQFRLAQDPEGREYFIRGAGEGEIFGWNIAGDKHVERTRRAESFVRYVERIAKGDTAPADYFVATSDALEIVENAAGNDYMMLFNNTRGGRWTSGGFTIFSVGAQTGVANINSAMNSAVNAWNNHADSSINLNFGGASPSQTCNYDDPDGDNAKQICFDQPDSGNLGGTVVGQARLWASTPTHNNGSDTYYTAFECDVIVEAGKTGSLFEAIVSHELGHCLGFRHSNQPATGQTTSGGSGNLMNSSVGAGGASLGTWDREAASVVYGAGIVCTPPSISTQPQNKSINTGASTSLSVVAAGTSPFTYQWYIGNAGDTSAPVPGGTSATINVAPTSTTTYWVRVTGQCNPPVDSAAATVTVTCAAPQITNQPNSPTITVGSSTNLSVTATGAGLTYQWYVGSPGNTSSPVPGGTSASVNVSPTVTTTYWVRVSGSCGGPVDSNAATVTVTCNPTGISTQPASKSIISGEQALLSVVATGTSPTYQWYIGTSGNTSTPVAGGTASALVVNPLVTTSYWVRVTGRCGSPVDSNTATITVTACTNPAITTQPVSVSVQPGGSAELSVAATGTNLTYQWYTGQSGDTSAPIAGATGPLRVVFPVQTTSYWVRVSGACGAPVNSQTVTVTVTTQCTAPSIVTHPQSATIDAGQSATLSVGAAGTAPLTYQWFLGQAGDTSTPLVSNAASITVSPTQTLRYWVRVTGQCGAPADSVTATVTVAAAKPGRRRAAGH